MEDKTETYECFGCGGEISVVEAIWLPERKSIIERPKTEKNAHPYCSFECFQQYQRKAITDLRQEFNL